MLKHKYKKDFELFLSKKLAMKIKEDDEFAVNCYRALCNTTWYNIHSRVNYGCSWRYAGGLIAQIRNYNETYMDFYCSGNEGQVNKKVEDAFNTVGWVKRRIK